MTDQPFGAFTPTDYQPIIRRDADLVLAALAAADLAAPVPACPGWDIQQLIDHLGRVHQWARLNAVSGLDSVSPKHPTSGVAAGEELTGWYAGCVEDLLKALAGTDPAQPCWTFQPGNQVARFWSRRQSHELAMHRNDLAAAVGASHHYEAAHAADGIGEVFDVFFPRRKSYRLPPVDAAAPVLLACTDRPERWLVTPHPDDPTEHVVAGPVLAPELAATAAVSITGPAGGLLLALWKRQDATELEVAGDPDLATRFLASKLTP